MVKLLKQHNWKSGAELGVQAGVLAKMFLKTSPSLHLIGVDNFSLDSSSREAVEALVEQFAPRYKLFAMDTDDASYLVEDGSLDFVFIDANHSEERTYADITHWNTKVKKGGWFGGDAYNPKWYPQTVRAVHRVYPKERVQVWPGRVWGVQV